MQEVAALIVTGLIFIIAVFVTVLFCRHVGGVWEKKGRRFSTGIIISLIFTPFIGLVIGLALKPDEKKIEEQKLQKGEIKNK